jgi:putative tricarboxylic transport membrane protein
VAGPETANNAATQSAFIPLFVIGIPFGPVTAILLGALLIHGVTPGPLLIAEQPQLFWAVVASMYIGNFILLVLNLPLVPLFANMLRVPMKVMLPLIMLFCFTGMFSVNYAALDIWMMLGFGVLGYVLRGWAYEGAPLLLGLVLGPKLEVAFRQSVMISHGDFAIFVDRPVSLGLLAATVLFLFFPLFKLAYRALRAKPDAAAPEGETR